MRYNRDPYNRSPYNRPAGRTLKCSAMLTGSTSLAVVAGVERSASAQMSGTASFDKDATRDLSATSEIMSASGDLKSTGGGVETIFGATMNAGATFTAEPSLDFHPTAALIAGSSSTLMDGGLLLDGDAAMAGYGELQAAPSVESPRQASFAGEGALDITGGLVERFASGRLSGGASLNMPDGDMDYGGKAILDASSDLIALPSVVFGPGAKMGGGSELLATARMDYAGNTHMRGGASIYAAFESIVQQGAIFHGTMNPGDILVINTCDFTVTLNGVNVIEQFECDEPLWIRLNDKSIKLDVDTDGFSDMGVKVDSSPHYY